MNRKITTVEEAWIRYHQKLFNFIRAKVETPEDAEDILDEVFAKLSEAANADAIPDHISAWLYSVTKNNIVDYYRTKKRFEPLPEELAPESAQTSAIAQLAECMLPMIQALPETYQQPLLLAEIEGKKYQEVATTLNLSVSAVKSRILRGRQMLHKSITKCCTIYRNDAGEVIDYEEKMNRFCREC